MATERYLWGELSKTEAYQNAYRNGNGNGGSGRKFVINPSRAYGKYTFDDANRDVNQARVERLAESADDLYLFDLYPIVTSTEGVIVDGQHRFSVQREMNLPLYVISGDDISIEDVAEANQNTRYYNADDTLSVYANMGVPSYVYLREFLERNEHVSSANARSWLDGDSVMDDFHGGDFAIRRPEYAQVVANRIKDFCSIHAWVRKSPYTRALANLTLNPVYDHERMMKRLAESPLRLLRVTKESEALEVLTSIYNYHRPKQHRVELAKIVSSQMVNRYDKEMFCPIEGIPTPMRGIAHQRQVSVSYTHNLDIFTAHPSARPVNSRKLNSMIEFMERRDLSRYYPILVTENGVIIDGQVRWEARKALGLPIYYIVTNNFSLHMAVLASRASTVWRLNDFLKHFCVRGFSEYLYLQSFVNRYPYLTLRGAIMFLSDTRRWQVAQHPYKTGHFKAIDKERAIRLARAIGMVDDPGLQWHTTFQYAMFNQLENPEFDVHKFVERLNRNRDLFGPYADISGCIEQMSKVYNNNVHAQNRVMLQRVNVQGSIGIPQHGDDE